MLHQHSYDSNMLQTIVDRYEYLYIVNCVGLPHALTRTAHLQFSELHNNVNSGNGLVPVA